MKRHYFLKGLSLTLSNYVGYTEYDNALFFITQSQSDTFQDLIENVIHFNTYFYNQDIKVSLYKENNNHYLLVEKLNAQELNFNNTYQANIEIVLNEVSNNIFK